jgi:DNA processing protein
LARTPHWVESSYQILNLSEAQGIRWVGLGSEDYPADWMALSLKPAVFSYQGDPVWKFMPMISIVGSRTPATETLLWMQRELPAFFKDRTLAVVSGGARGVDQWSHRLALDCGKPTVCVLPSGILNPYPFQREELWARIVKHGGCMLSTCALRAPMLTHYFHVRNRWIAGLGRILLVAEANRRSGSMLTARLAIDEDKTVCTLPVFPTAVQGLGNLDLISQGAFFMRDHRDLAVLWDTLTLAANLGPTTLENFYREREKDRIDAPQAESGGNGSGLGHAVGGGVAYPVGD